MKTIFRILIATGVLIAGPASAADATALMSYATTERAIEATSGNIVLPQGPNSALVLTPCAGCTPRSLMSSEKTLYFMKRQPVTLAQLKAALTGKVDVYVGVFQSTRTGELTRVVANLNAPVARGRATP